MALNWNWDEIKVSSFEVLPAGDFEAAITQVEEKDTRNGGKYWRVCFQVTKGSHLGANVYNNFNIENDNLETQKWARSDIKAIALQNDKEDELDSPQDLIGMHCSIKVSVVESEKYGEQNQVRILRPKTTKKSGLDNAAPSASFKDDQIPF